jgi:lipoyl synthase
MPRSRSNGRQRRADEAQVRGADLRQSRRPADGGAAHYAACIRAIKQRNPDTAVEALTPDFQGVLRDVRPCWTRAGGVRAERRDGERLTHPVRDPRAGYEQTLAVLAHAKRTDRRC